MTFEETRRALIKTCMQFSKDFPFECVVVFRHPDEWNGEFSTVAHGKPGQKHNAAFLEEVMQAMKQ